MTRPVLFGGRTGLRARNAATWFLMVWLPVGISLAIILRESTNSFSSEQTSGPLRHLFEWIFGPVEPARWEVVHHVMRKTGHFLGYGLAGLAWLRAWLLTWLAPLRLRGIWTWRRFSLLMALLCTMVTATADEVHQTYIPRPHRPHQRCLARHTAGAGRDDALYGLLLDSQAVAERAEGPSWRGKLRVWTSLSTDFRCRFASVRLCP